MPRKQKKAPNGITWNAARRKAHGKKIQAGRRNHVAIVARFRAAHEAKGTITPGVDAQPQRLDLSEAIRTKVRAILPGIIDQELAALLKP